MISKLSETIENFNKEYTSGPTTVENIINNLWYSNNLR